MAILAYARVNTQDQDLSGQIEALTAAGATRSSRKRSAVPRPRIGPVGASFKSLGDPLWDTTSSQGRLLSTLLAAIAEFERELIRERTGEGRKRAMAKGVRFGRRPS